MLRVVETRSLLKRYFTAGANVRRKANSNTPRFLYPNGAVNFMCAVGSQVTYCQKQWHEVSRCLNKELSQNGGQAKFSLKTAAPHPFVKTYLTINTTLNQIYLGGYYL
jgi:hypothetical protein